MPPPQSESRSPSPYSKRASRTYTNNDRSRSRSPRRRDDRPKKSSGGFRWKEKPQGDEDESQKDDRRLERGYREQRRRRSPPVRDEREIDVEAKFGRQRSPVRRTSNGAQNGNDDRGQEEDRKREKKEKKKREKAPVVTSQEMIIVNVNDRLGTKASIPCLGSDPIKLFKAQVAARIGRQPHEIMLKRQGERPFKDHLTLEDYGVSNGVQLDLEIDTGD
ncbi:hypothetical protein ACLMJK_007577 [Lecanora helva]